MFNSLLSNASRLLLIYAALLNVGLGVAFGMFLLDPATVLPLFHRFVRRGTPDFIMGLIVPSWSDSWFVVCMALNSTWLVPMFSLTALRFIHDGVRPELAKQGIVQLGRGTSTRVDDSVSWFGVTNGALFGIAMLGSIAMLVSSALTSTGFQKFAEEKQLQSFSVSGTIDGYRAFVRGAVGINPAPAAQPASAATNAH